MKSIKELYRIGTGPSSSHTMGPVSYTHLDVYKRQTTRFAYVVVGSPEVIRVLP